MAWTWDLDTFAALWFNEGNDRMPSPLRYRSRFATLDELEAHQSAVRAGYRGEERTRIDLLVHTVASCDMRFEIICSTVSYKGSDGKTPKHRRMVGARNAHYAALLHQTGTHDEFGDIHARLVDPDQLPAALAGALPPCKPGSQPRATFHVDELKPSTGYKVDNARNSSRERFDRLARRPADGGGQAILRLGTFHAQPNRHRALQWYDITGDGRYVEHRDHTYLDIRPGTPQDLTATFASWMDQAMQQLRAREADAWY
ncbi:ESX secretion-associated protein EspG [Nocardia sp. NPDC050710]|uniref:ESX secretion-associated protein EspG n=1 Tax=Nocardia sp. NPDC050710 TaxID=3157220 RepID=UPI0033BFF7F4